jgi:hypothetical protein
MQAQLSMAWAGWLTKQDTKVLCGLSGCTLGWCGGEMPQWVQGVSDNCQKERQLQF